ncbi:hypothetical protein [Archangium primigenium]|nr:hypothetical protein [Archangium primigenium]MBM7116797.1 hypothetical protein [Archangium primigenium]
MGRPGRARGPAQALETLQALESRGALLTVKLLDPPTFDYRAKLIGVY